MEINLEPTDCPRLLRRVMDAFHVSSGKPGVELLCKVEEMPALMIDPQHLRQIVFNLVGNAVKFTEMVFDGILLKHVTTETLGKAISGGS